MRKNSFIFFLFLIIYSLVSLINHYLFRTNALDLGVFNHALYNYSHLKLSYFTLGISEQETGIIECFGNHFSPIILFFTPLYYLFGSYTMLIVQIGFILLGGWGIYKYAKLCQLSEKLITLSLFHFFSMWGIFSALSFDFHMNVIAAMLVPWLLYYYQKENIKYLLAVTFLMLITRENISLWLVFIFTGLWIHNKFKPLAGKRYIVPMLIVATTFYFFLVIQFVMPEFVPYKSEGQLSRYSYLGNSLVEIMQSIISSPVETIKLLVTSQFDEEIFRHIKMELHIMVLLSGGFLFFKKPAFLVMLLPVFFQKLLSTDYGMWGINYHYSIEFVPILSLMSIESVANMKKEKTKTILYSCILGATVLSTTYTFFHRESVWYKKENTCLICPEHYKTELNISLIKQTISQIPPNASVSAHYSIAAHLASRKNIYHFPVVKDAEFIVLLKKASSYYPLQENEYFDKIDTYRNDSDFSIWQENPSVIIFKRTI